LNAFPIFFGGFVATLLCWLTLVVYSVIDRLRHDRLMRYLRECCHAAPAPDGAAGGGETLGATLSRRTMYALVADPAQSDGLKDRLATLILERDGAGRVAQEAGGGRWRMGRWRRVAALHVLCRTGAPQVHQLLRAALSDRDRAVAAAAVVLLGKLRDRRAAAILIEALRNNWHAPARIATQLDQFDASVAVDLLFVLLEDRHPQRRYWAISLLLRHRMAARLDGRLAACADDPDASVRKAVAQAMGVIGGARATAVAIGLLDDPAAFVRAHAVRALGKIAAHGGGAAGPLVAPRLADRDWWVRLAAREALVAMGAGVRQEVAAQLASRDGFARDGAADVLRQIGRLRESDALAASAGGQ
jgi:hypothetical protein